VELDTVWFTVPVSLFFNSMGAPETTAPAGSEMVPVMVPVAV
jgi:hypothetical protein